MQSTPSHTISLGNILIYLQSTLWSSKWPLSLGFVLIPQYRDVKHPWLSHNSSTLELVDSGHAMPREGICPPVATEVHVQYQASPCRILWWTKWQWDRFFCVCWISPVSIQSPMIYTHSFNHHQYCIR